MNTEYIVHEYEGKYQVLMLHRGLLVQVVMVTDNRQKAFRIVEKFNGKRRATARKNKQEMTLRFDQH